MARPGTVTIAFSPPLAFIQKQSGRFAAALNNLDELWDRFKPLMSEFEDEWFFSRGQGAWPELAESTIRQKGSSEILVDTGALRESLIDPASAARTTSKTMEWGTDVGYAGYHQEGGSIEGRPPQRQVIPDPFPTEWRREFERETVNYVNDAARRTWGLV